MKQPFAASRECTSQPMAPATFGPGEAAANTFDVTDASSGIIRGRARPGRNSSAGRALTCATRQRQLIMLRYCGVSVVKKSRWRHRFPHREVPFFCPDLSHPGVDAVQASVTERRGLELKSIRVATPIPVQVLAALATAVVEWASCAPDRFSLRGQSFASLEQQ